MITVLTAAVPTAEAACPTLPTAFLYAPPIFCARLGAGAACLFIPGLDAGVGATFCAAAGFDAGVGAACCAAAGASIITCSMFSINRCSCKYSMPSIIG